VPYKVFELADTTSTAIRGEGDTVYRMEPRIWLKNIIDAAKIRHLATQFAYQTTLGPNQKDVVIPKRRKYLGSGVAWATEGNSVSYTTMNNLSGVSITPLPSNYGIAISTEAIRTNAVDLVRAAREELTYMVGDNVDVEVFRALKDDSQRATSSTLGSQAIYGGDATQSSELTSVDTISVDMVAAAKRKLQSTVCKYWTYGTGESDSSETKNPWQNTPDAPFVLFIAPEQEEVFLTDSQFVNASEYGSDKVINNGEIGSYLGIKLVVSNNTPYYAASATHADGQTTSVAQHRCIMMKAQKAVGLVWGQKPKLVSFPYPSQLEHRLIIEQSYKAGIVHPDAIVHINVAD